MPDSSGTLDEGRQIFKENCSKCHGHSGEGLTAPELVGKSSLVSNEISKTIGNFWPYAPKIFDYINRTKRNLVGEYFSYQEVYSITGYILSLNELFDSQVIDKETLSNIEMPNRNGFITHWN